MKSDRGSKKTSTIELRVSPELKDAIGQFSAARGETVSETIRSVVASELRSGGGRKPHGVMMMQNAMRRPVMRGAMMMASVGLLAVAYSLAVQGPAAASVGAEARVTFAEIDRDGDDLITREEYAAVIAEERALEADDMPVVPAACQGTFIAEEIEEERAEWAVPPEDLAGERIAYLDSDADGAVTFDELEAYLVAERARDFLEFDEDGNGFVTLNEVEKSLSGPARAEEEAELAEAGLSADCIATLLGEEGAEDTDDVEDPRLVLAEFDADRDGRVSLWEFLDR